MLPSSLALVGIDHPPHNQLSPRIKDPTSTYVLPANGRRTGRTPPFTASFARALLTLGGQAWVVRRWMWANSALGFAALTPTCRSR